jgi:transposase, IS5 family
MEEPFSNTPLYREFARLSAFGRLTEQITIIRLHHRLEKHKLADQMRVTFKALLEQRGLLLKTGSAVEKRSSGRPRAAQA